MHTIVEAKPSGFMSGWYPILPSDELKIRSKPTAIKRLGVDFVLWRQQNGQVCVLQDHCPHRGAKLSLGKICNDQIRCPFHGFEFDGNGICVFAPEFSKAIPGLQAKAWEVKEHIGMIWAYWGSATAPFDYPDITDIHQKFKGHFSCISRQWHSPITYCIENQLDYTHLKFVHHNTIGRGFVMPIDPHVEADEKKIRVFLKNPLEPSLSYYFPGVWVLNVGKSMQLMLFFSPIDSENTQLCLRAYRHFLTQPVIKWPIDYLMNLFNRIILKQDESVVASQGLNPSPQAMGDLLMRHDKAISHFRKQWLNCCE